MNSLKLGIILLTLIIISDLSAFSCRSWIDDPCTTELSQNYCRTKRSDHFFVIRNQIRICIVQLKLSMKRIDRMYVVGKKQGTSYSDPRAKLSWLNVKKMMYQIKHSPSQLKQIENMFHSLQKFAESLVVLRNVTIDAGEYFLNEHRRSVYKNVGYQMRSLLCEVRYSQQVESEEILKELPFRSMGILLFENSVNRQTGHLMDVTFFRKTLTFLKRILSLLFRRRSGKSRDSMLRTSTRV